MSNVSEVLGQKAVEWVNGLEALTKAYAPKAVDAALQVVQINAVSHLIKAGICLVICAVLVFLSGRACVREYRKEYGDVELVLGWGFLCLFPFIFGVFALIEFADVWSWVAIFQPKLAVAHMIFAKVAQ